VQSLCADDVKDSIPLFPNGSGGAIPTSALHLQIVRVKSELAKYYNEKWHSSMPLMDAYKFCKPCYAAMFDDIVYAVAMWSLPIAANRLKNGRFALELRRMAIGPDAPKNTASRMLSVMTRDIKRTMPHVVRLLSYQDTGKHKGAIYAAAGWRMAATCEYVDWGVHSKRPGKVKQSLAPKIRWESDIREVRCPIGG